MLCHNLEVSATGVALPFKPTSKMQCIWRIWKPNLLQNLAFCRRKLRIRWKNVLY